MKSKKESNTPAVRNKYTAQFKEQCKTAFNFSIIQHRFSSQEKQRRH